MWPWPAPWTATRSSLAGLVVGTSYGRAVRLRQSVNKSLPVLVPSGNVRKQIDFPGCMEKRPPLGVSRFGSLQIARSSSRARTAECGLNAGKAVPGPGCPSCGLDFRQESRPTPLPPCHAPFSQGQAAWRGEAFPLRFLGVFSHEGPSQWWGRGPSWVLRRSSDPERPPGACSGWVARARPFFQWQSLFKGYRGEAFKRKRPSLSSPPSLSLPLLPPLLAMRP